MNFDEYERRIRLERMANGGKTDAEVAHDRQLADIGAQNKRAKVAVVAFVKELPSLKKPDGTYDGEAIADRLAHVFDEMLLSRLMRMVENGELAKALAPLGLARREDIGPHFY